LEGGGAKKSREGFGAASGRGETLNSLGTRNLKKNHSGQERKI